MGHLRKYFGLKNCSLWENMNYSSANLGILKNLEWNHICINVILALPQRIATVSFRKSSSVKILRRHHSSIGETYRLKSAILNDGVDDLLVGHQSPALREVVLRVLLGHTTHAANICEHFGGNVCENILRKYLVNMFSGNIW